ncbi:hypothetical protein HOS59_gp29 [Streptomyces phage Rowa]|uniref:Uncharacterized protein n=1 Tax=Streptomyces phage Rowa TaxID=2059883 RepID=A0A2H5BLW3_9CAUD|nr:hypothetical protein HOS59_gp29 [Streptomyces phage Rowa]AUG87293.1 hypothetical protein SEA_ROWA_29 [Streptomyces phage Rowa]
MRQKRAYPINLSSVSATSNGQVLMYAWVTEGPDAQRPLQCHADPEWVRGYAARLVEAAEATEKHTAERLARLEAQKGQQQP